MADVGLRKVIVGAVADPSLYVKLREVSVKEPTLTVTVLAPVVPQEGTKKSALILLTDWIVAFFEQISMVILDLSRGKPYPLRLIKNPPLSPPVDVEREVATRLTLKGLTPLCNAAIP